MNVVVTSAQLQSALDAAAPRGPVVLVPTMGALHRGHWELIRQARLEAGAGGMVIVSIFVNPIQFDRAADLEAYPRPQEDDLAQCRAAGVDMVFMPEASSMYAADRSVLVHESLLSRGLCGAKRPGHFDGVCTVVLKLFMLTRCDAAVFGEKDFQQLAIVRRMVRDLDLPIRIVACPTVRESDGLAMSSRNRRLTPEQRADAPRIHRVLTEAARMEDVRSMIDAAHRGLADSTLAAIEYLELVDAETLQPVDALARDAVLATAVFYGEVRLIDHVRVPARPA